MHKSRPSWKKLFSLKGSINLARESLSPLSLSPSRVTVIEFSISFYIPRLSSSPSPPSLPYITLCSISNYVPRTSDQNLVSPFSLSLSSFKSCTIKSNLNLSLFNTSRSIQPEVWFFVLIPVFVSFFILYFHAAFGFLCHFLGVESGGDFQEGWTGMREGGSENGVDFILKIYPFSDKMSNSLFSSEHNV